MKAKTLYWIPRIFTILAILFMLMFSFDVFSGNETFGRKMLGFLMHNIPVLILIIVLVIAWKWEFIGGLLLVIAAIGGSIFFYSFTKNTGSLIVMTPFLITGLLFIIHHVLYVKNPGKA
jgi:hypothetical protein